MFTTQFRCGIGKTVSTPSNRSASGAKPTSLSMYEATCIHLRNHLNIHTRYSHAYDAENLQSFMPMPLPFRIYIQCQQEERSPRKNVRAPIHVLHSCSHLIRSSPPLGYRPWRACVRMRMQRHVSAGMCRQWHLAGCVTVCLPCQLAHDKCKHTSHNTTVVCFG
jgi:hypothetical protein